MGKGEILIQNKLLKNEKNLCFHNLTAIYGFYFSCTGIFDGHCHFC